MREMKDSGVEWIGKIPVNWDICKLKNIATIQTGNTPTKSEQSDFYSDIEGIPWIKAEDLGTGVAITKTREYLTPKGAQLGRVFPIYTVFVCCIASIGKTGYSECECSCNQQINGVTFYGAYWKYGYYLTLAQEKEYILGASGNVMKIINSEKQSNLFCTLPPNNIQRQIANYLDRKCAAIDNIITKQEQIIERLKEYKSSIITEAVTKGLDSRVEMKDSGILSIGCIPKHWIALKLKYLFEKGDNGLKIGPFGSAMKGKTLEQGPYKIYNQAHLIQNDFSLSRHFVSEDTFNELKNYEVVPGDILFSMMGTVGKCQIMPQGYPKGIMDSHLLKARLNDRILPEFFVYAYDKDYSYQAISQLLYISNGTIMNGLNSSILKNVVIALPPMEEQKQIIKYIKSFSDKIDKRIAKLSTMVEKLNIYKKSLIYEVVTGKKEV